MVSRSPGEATVASDFASNISKSDSMKSRISATQAARSFSDLMNRVRYRGEGFIVERGGKPICEILPATPLKFSGAELANLLRSLPKPDGITSRRRRT